MYVMTTQIVHAYYAIHIALRFPAWTISKTECAPAGRILTNRSSTNLLITGMTNWRLWFDWMVDTLNSCFWLSGSFAAVLCCV